MIEVVMKHRTVWGVIAAVAVFFCTMLAVASDQVPAPPQKQPIALVGGTIHTVSGETISNGTILFDAGKIVAVGTEVPIPAGAMQVDIAGKHVYPALIHSYTLLGLFEIGAVSATLDFAETGQLNPNVRAEVAINPDSELLPVARANGIGIAVAVPQSGLIAGKAAAFMLDGWTWEDMTVKAPVGMVINWPNLRISTSPFVRTPPERQRENMKKRLADIQQIFDDARAYQAAHAAAGQAGLPVHKRDARLEALLPVLSGELPVWIAANDIKQIRSAVDWATREKLKMVLVGGADAYLAADLLARHDIPVIITQVLRLPSRRHEAFDEPFRLAQKLHGAGVRFCIAGFETFNGVDQNLPYHAAKAASYGLPKAEALKAVTLYPAQILGLADRAGSLETGKDATLMVTDGDPLEIATQVEKLYLQGRDVDLGNRHKSLYEKYRQRYRQRDAATNSRGD